MHYFKHSVALALFAALSLGSLSAQAYEQDKTYKITILHTNDHHGHFWRNDYGEYDRRRKKRWWTVFVKRWRPKAVAFCCCPAGISIPGYRSLIYRMQSPIFAA